MTQKVAVFPGSFDPYTIGHDDIINRALPMFDQIIIAIGNNSAKQHLLNAESRLEKIRSHYKNEPKILVEIYSGLTAEYCETKGAKTIIRGLRSVIDFEYEQPIAQMNAEIANQPETIFFMCKPEHAHISSTIIRDIIKNGGNASKWMI
ncbi:MAG: pantetheine-phosphate adenylyltransferase [Bacteroidetes bacterium]|nr:pantetheine-phosphate adenylyltransferase [Bacteroidota bacterium]